MDNEMLKNIQIEIQSYYKQYLYLENVMQMNFYVSEVLMRGKENSKMRNLLEIVEAATLDSIILSLSRFYDNDSNTKNIRNLIKKGKSNSDLLNAEKRTKLLNKLEEFENCLNTDKDFASSVKILKMRRDKIFVHNDKKFFNNPKKDKTYLPMYKLCILCQHINQLLDTLAEFYDITFDKEIICNHDIDELVNSIIK